MTPDNDKPTKDDAELNPSSPQQDEDAQLEKEFAELLDQHLPGGSEGSRGELMELPVVAIRDEYVLVDIGGKAEAGIPIDEFPKVNGQPNVQIGQTIRVVQIGRTSDGTPRLSFRQARNREAQKFIREALEKHEAVEGTVSEVVKGGVMVDIGLEAFMPASQMDLFKIPDLNSLVGRKIEAYVLEFDARRNRAVLSRRQLLFERRENERKAFLASMEPGKVVLGKVKSCLDFGVFVDLGIVDGFVPREEVSWDRGKAPADILVPGTEVELKVLSISADQGKVTLSRKRLVDNPWEKVEDIYQVGTPIRGKVVAIEAYGAFVQLREGLTGMIHASDMSWATGNKKPEDYVSLGQEVTAQVLEVNKDKKRISLGLKQLATDPWIEVERKYAPDTKHHGTVSSITNYGAFIKLDDFVEGMVHVSDLSWEKRVSHPKDYLKVGDPVDVVVLKTDRENRRISLGMKQLADSPYDAFLKAHPVGTVVKGKVTRFAPFGAFVELSSGLEGLIHISQIDEKRVELPEKALNVGDEVTVKIIAAEKKNQKISLSRKEATKAAEKEQMKTYMKKQNDQPGGMSFGEALRAAKEKKD